MSDATLLIVPGLRDHAPDHWQTILAARAPRAISVEPMGRENVDLAVRIEAIEAAANAISGPIIVVAHSAGCLMVVHWAAVTQREVQGALLAAPPDFETRMPAGYPSLDDLRTGGWFPIPREPLPFKALVAASRNDPLARFERVAALTRHWGSCLVDLGDVGHLNPASGFGFWPDAERFVADLATARDPSTPLRMTAEQE